MSDNTQPTENGVQLDLLNRSQLDSMETMEKIRFILDSIKTNNIVILESGLQPDEEAKLIEMTMNEINRDFSGIEIESWPSKTEKSSGLFGRVKSSLQQDNTTSNLTVIGPSDALETIHKDDSLIQTLVQGD